MHIVLKYPYIILLFSKQFSPYKYFTHNTIIRSNYFLRFKLLLFNTELIHNNTWVKNSMKINFQMYTNYI